MNMIHPNTQKHNPPAGNSRREIYAPLLHKRGIYDVWCAAGLQEVRGGWDYPVYDLAGNIIARRFKNATPNGAKYYWRTDKGDAVYYFPDHKNFLAAIEAEQGRVYIANGEPAALAYLAAGKSNVFSWFGEKSVPDTLADDLVAWGVTEVIYIPDNDGTGHDSAADVRYLTASSGIALRLLAWGNRPEKYDANDLWIDCQFDPAAFWQAIGELHALILPRETRQPQTVYDWSDDAPPADLISAVARYLGVSGRRVNADGWTQGKRIPNPVNPHEHDHKNPASLFNMNSGVLHDHRRGESYGLYTLAVCAGIDLTPYKRQRPTARPDDTSIDEKYADAMPDAGAIWDEIEPENVISRSALSQSDKPAATADYLHSHNANQAESAPAKKYTPLNRSVTPDPELRLITPSTTAPDMPPTEGELQTAHHALYGAGDMIYWIMRITPIRFWTRALIVEEAHRQGLPLTIDQVDNWFKREGEYFTVILNTESVKKYYHQIYGKVPNGRLSDHFELRDLSERLANLFTLAQKRAKERAVKAGRKEAHDDDATDPIWWDDELSQAIADDLEISPTDADTLKNRVNTHYTRQRAEDDAFRKRINRAYRKYKRPEQELADKLKASDFADFRIPAFLKAADDTAQNIYYAAFLYWYNEQNPGVKMSNSKICRLLGINSNDRAGHIRKLAKLEHASEDATWFTAAIEFPADMPDDERPEYAKHQIIQLAKDNEARPMRVSAEDYDLGYKDESVRIVARAANVIYAEFRQAAPLVHNPDMPAPVKKVSIVTSSSHEEEVNETTPRRAVEHPYGIDYWPTFRQGQIREAIKSRGWKLDTGQWVAPTGQRWSDDRAALLVAFDMPGAPQEDQDMLSIHHMSEKYDEQEELLPQEEAGQWVIEIEYRIPTLAERLAGKDELQVVSRNRVWKSALQEVS